MNKKKNGIAGVLKGENTMLLFAVALFAVCLILVPRFATGGNIKNILIQISINALIACGMTFTILSDGIDLSVGSVAAIAGVAGASLVKTMPNASVPMSIIIIILTSLVIGTICGAINGFCIAKLNVPPFIATMAMKGNRHHSGLCYLDGSDYRIELCHFDKNLLWQICLCCGK